jgi:hypothetical protein
VTGHNLTVRRLRWREPGPNRLAARHRLELALEAGGNASALRPEAILCVRRLATSFPDLDRLSNVLDAELRDAARPARGTVPANANAVLFADRAELLACLARDWCAGNTATVWWWPVFFPGDDLGAVVRRAWLEDARPVPAALARLEAANLAPKFLTRFSPSDRAALWRNLVNTFQLGAFDVAWSRGDIADAAPTAAPAPRELAPWSAWVNPPASLALDGVRILVACILLERAPARMRSRSFAREVGMWIESRKRHDALDVPINERFSSAEESPAEGDPPPRVMAPLHRRSTLKQEPASALNRKSVATPGASNPESIVIPGSPRIESTKIESRAAPANRPRREEDPLAFRTPESPVMPLELEQERPSDLPEAPDESMALPAAAAPDCTSTEWGGSLYLVNIAIALEIYGDFTEPSRRGLALPLWDFLALLAGQMIGEEFAEDPLCSLFARLSGRGGDEPPGAQFEPPSGETLAIWLARVCHDMEARAIAALGLDDNRDLRSLVLNHPARIETNSTRLDAYFALANHPIALRIAGLDRDPGWVPAAGRGIYFHYD